MLKKLTLSNFQCHREFTLPLHPQATVLVGQSDKGKSAVLRAFRWLVTNRPTGDSFISHGEDTATVTLEVDGRAIVRRRGPGVNSYSLDGKEYKAFGSDVPIDIANLLNLGEENFQGQHSDPFWFLRTAGEVSKELNKIVNLDLIDKTLANVATYQRSAKATTQVSKERLLNARTERDNLEWVNECNLNLCTIEELDCTRVQYEKQGRRLNEIATQGQTLTNTVETCLRAEINGAKGLQIGSTLQEVSTQVDQLDGLLYKVIQFQTVLDKLIPTKPIERLEAIRAQHTKARFNATALRDQITRLETSLEEAAKCEKNYQTAHREWKDLTGDSCPLCGQPTK